MTTRDELTSAPEQNDEVQAITTMKIQSKAQRSRPCSRRSTQYYHKILILIYYHKLIIKYHHKLIIKYYHKLIMKYHHKLIIKYHHKLIIKYFYKLIILIIKINIIIKY